MPKFYSATLDSNKYRGFSYLTLVLRPAWRYDLNIKSSSSLCIAFIPFYFQYQQALSKTFTSTTFPILATSPTCSCFKSNFMSLVFQHLSGSPLSGTQIIGPRGCSGLETLTWNTLALESKQTFIPVFLCAEMWQALCSTGIDTRSNYLSEDSPPNLSS